MKKLNPEYIKRVNQLVDRSPYFELLSMKIKDVGLGFSVLEIDLAENSRACCRTGTGQLRIYSRRLFLYKI